MTHSYRLTKLAAYTTNVSMSVVANLAPLLFLTFRERYGLSYSLLGTLVLINFVTQLGVDLLLSVGASRIRADRLIPWIPVLTAGGLGILAAASLLPQGYVFGGLVVGTLLYSAAGGLSEVLISPMIAAIPSDHPDREMSRLHASYAWGVVGVVVLSSLLLWLIGSNRWPLLPLIWMAIPLLAALLYRLAPMPDMTLGGQAKGSGGALRTRSFRLCLVAIFLGGITECTMAQWSSGYIERSLGLPKLVGDILGVAAFGLAMAVGRSLYAKKGKRIEPVLLLGSLGATACYLISALSPTPYLALAAVALTGLCASMLWPGSLIAMTDRFPAAGVGMFALMAAGGDLGASVGPQLVGIVTDAVLNSSRLPALCALTGLEAEAVAMKAGILITSVFPLLLTVVCTLLLRERRRKDSV